MDKLVVAALVVLPWSTLDYGQVAVDHEEFVGPFPSWANVKTDFGAIGDGSADDTEAFQKALDTFQQTSNVLFLPAGVYRITRTLTMTIRQCLSLLGDDPARTVIKWDGADEGSHAAIVSATHLWPAVAAFSRVWGELIRRIGGESWKSSGALIEAIRREKIPTLLNGIFD